MTFFQLSRCRRRFWAQWPGHKFRSMSRSIEEYAVATGTTEATPSLKRKEHLPETFEEAGLRAPVVAALRAAFPNIERPTFAQGKFIPAIMSGNDVILKDETGSGKSFGIILALLNKPRLRFRDPETGELNSNPSLTSLFLVPHRDLAFQLYHWIQRMATGHNAEVPPHLPSIAQVLVRDDQSHLTSGLSLLLKEAPHLLIATPQAVMDVWNKDQNAIQLSQLSTVVVDEVDYLIDTSPIRRTKFSRSKARAKHYKEKIERHPGVTRELLDIIYSQRLSSDPRNQIRAHAPQLILSSATLSLHLSEYLHENSGWLNKGSVVNVRGENTSPKAPSDVHGTLGKPASSRKGITHSVVIVSDHETVNIISAVPDKKPARILVPKDDESDPSSMEITVDAELTSKYENKPSPFNPHVLEAIATAFAVDVPSFALLAIPASSSVTRAVYDLRCMGVNAHGLDLLTDRKGRAYLLQGNAQRVLNQPTLLVCTPATTRGIDLPELTHVFILGIPDGATGGKRNSDTYVHLAGRVGRFGRGGRVVTFVEKGEDLESDWKSFQAPDASRMLNMFKRISVTPVRYE
ncbi:P-loop containing nucleoside triphosphate hydrolase protein, partial [Mycena floridula]